MTVCFTMKIDVSDLLKHVGAKLKIEECEELSFREDELNLASPVSAKLELVNTGRTILITGDLKAKVRLECCRCLKEFECPVSLKIEEEYEKPKSAALARNEQNSSEEEEIRLNEKDFVFQIGENNVIDLDEAIRQNIIIALPIKLLCNKACKGIEVERAAVKKKIDPRLAKLKEIMKNAGT